MHSSNLFKLYTQKCNINAKISLNRYQCFPPLCNKKSPNESAAIEIAK